jgi:YebC/PmpR family DNA-binding regulatory protein
MSGHSKWSTIKRAKGAADAKRGQLFTKLGREITIAARDGGTDPDANARLRLAIQKARDSNMPMDNIDRAIKKAAGGADGISLDELTLEGYGPGGAALLIQIVTDNRNRTVPEIRSILSRSNASLGESGCVTWVFQQKGLISIKANSDVEELELIAIDAGADDIKAENNVVEIYTNADELEEVRSSLEKANIVIASAELTLFPQNMVRLDDKNSLQTLRLLDKLEEVDGVQNVFTNADFPDSVLESYRSL